MTTESGGPSRWARLSPWRLINAVGAAITFIGAVLPVVKIPSWQRRRARSVLLALRWVIAVSCVIHALVDVTARILSLAGVLHMDLPLFASIDRREADLQDLLLNEPWFLVEGLLWDALGWLRFESCIVWSYFCVLDPRVAADIDYTCRRDRCREPFEGWPVLRL